MGVRNGLADIGLRPIDGLAGDLAVAAEFPPSDVLKGFDGIVQFSQKLLQSQVVRSLRAAGLADLRAHVPGGSVPLPPALASKVPPLLAAVAGDAQLEVRLHSPYLRALHWPDDPVGPVGPPVATARLRQPWVEIGWTLELNLLTLRNQPDIAIPLDQLAGGNGGTATATATTGRLSMPPLWRRSLLAGGEAVTAADAGLSVQSAIWRFGMMLDFSGTGAQAASDSADLVAFVTDGAGAGLLAHALVPLKATTDVRLTPDVVPAGPVTAALVQAMNLPALSIRHRLVTNAQGNPILCLCAELGSATDGLVQLVQPFIERCDFAYAASLRLLAPALKARWSLAAAGLATVRDVPLEMPVEEGSSETGTGRVQVRLSYSPVLDDVALQPATDGRGDPIRLLSRPTLRVLGLWDPAGNRITDLGELAEPVRQAMALNLHLIDRTGPRPEDLPANIRDFLAQIMRVVSFPIVPGFAASRAGPSGFTSSGLNTTMIRWSLKSLMEDITVDPGTLGGVHA